MPSDLMDPDHFSWQQTILLAGLASARDGELALALPILQPNEEWVGCVILDAAHAVASAGGIPIGAGVAQGGHHMLHVMRSAPAVRARQLVLRFRHEYLLTRPWKRMVPCWFQHACQCCNSEEDVEVDSGGNGGSSVAGDNQEWLDGAGWSDDEEASEDCTRPTPMGCLPRGHCRRGPDSIMHTVMVPTVTVFARLRS